MKKFLNIIILIFLVSLTACDLNSENKITQDDLLSDASKFENGVSTALDYNNGLVSEISLLQVEYAKVDNIMNEDGFDLNDSDFYTRYIVAYNSFKNECQRIKSVVSKVAPVGTGGPEFKRVSLECADAYIDLANLIDAESVINVLNNADEGQYSLIEASYERVDQKENNYILMNERFCNLNDITMGEAVDIEALAK